MKRTWKQTVVVMCVALLWSATATAQGPGEGPQEPPPQEEPAQEQAAQAEPDPATKHEAHKKAEDDFWPKALSMGGIGGIHAGLYTFAYFAWYRGRNISDELVFRDEGYFALDTYAGGADKLGHMYSNYALTRGTFQILRYGGWSPTVSNAAAGGLTLAFFTAIEIKDGFHQNFGFSWGDMTFNLLGISLALAMENFEWVDRHFDYRVEYVPTKLFIDQLLEDGVVDAAEDYSGQTFILAHHLRAHQAIRQSEYFGWMRYMDVAIGFGSRNYLPKPIDPRALRHQDIFLGVALNTQEVINQIFFPQRSQHKGVGYKSQRFVTEILAVPFTTLPVITRERTEQIVP